MNATDELYQQVILDYNKSPRNFHALPGATHHAQGLNPLCGDAYEIFLVVDAGGIIREAAFQGQGCAISKASASLMTQEVKGKTVEEARALFAAFHGLLLKETLAEEQSGLLGKLKVFAGVWRYPSRVKCAALAWHALDTALRGGQTVSTEDKL